MPAGGTSASGGGGGGGVSGSTGDAVRKVGAVGAGAAGSPLVFPAPMARRTRPRGRAPRSLDDRDRRRAVSATRGLQRYIIICGATVSPLCTILTTAAVFMNTFLIHAKSGFSSHQRPYHQLPEEARVCYQLPSTH